jgi:hypothetical protein
MINKLKRRAFCHVLSSFVPECRIWQMEPKGLLVPLQPCKNKRFGVNMEGRLWVSNNLIKGQDYVIKDRKIMLTLQAAKKVALQFDTERSRELAGLLDVALRKEHKSTLTCKDQAEQTQLWSPD